MKGRYSALTWLSLGLVMIFAVVGDAEGGYLDKAQYGQQNMVDISVSDVEGIDDQINDRAASISAGGWFTCAVTPYGGVKCWGENTDRQLGDGTLTNRSMPVDVIGLSSGVDSVSAGWGHTCALTTSGGVKCWGGGSLSPVDVAGLSSGVVSISAGWRHTCALTSSGGVKCWGYNAYGQLGDGTTTDSTSPMDVVGLGSGVVSVSAGGFHTCAVTDSGGVKCWGENTYGQLGNGTTIHSSTPVEVVDLTTSVDSVSAGYDHTCAVTAEGVAKCWGRNHAGHLGDGTTIDKSTPVDVVGLTSGVVSVKAGGAHTCALTEAGGVKCWGDNYFSQLGDGTYIESHIPIDVFSLSSGVDSISIGVAHTCALTTTGGIKCWGNDYSGQLGDGDPIVHQYTPVDVIELYNETAAVSAGSQHTCALTADGGVKCWGYNASGQLGDGNISNSSIPIDVINLTSGAGPVSAGTSHSCAVTAEGGVKCWGNNYWGQLGDGTTTDSPIPVEVAGLSGEIDSVGTGWGHTCTLTTSGGVMCWGCNSSGQLGDGTTTDSHTPVDVVGLSEGVASISVGSDHTCALMTSGGVKCWGGNFSAQLGNNTATDSPTPVDVLELSSGVHLVSAGSEHTCAVMQAGGVKCWGSNYRGQLGVENIIISFTPIDVSGLTNGVASVSAGGEHTCAVTASGGVKCWGYNVNGQLGDGTTTNRSTPIDVLSLNIGVVSVSAGYRHTCAVTASGGVKCWGRNYEGQLGWKRIWVPVDVLGFEGNLGNVLFFPLISR